MRFTLLTWNIRKGKGASGFDTAFPLVIEAIEAHRPDVLLCQEVFHGHGSGNGRGNGDAEGVDQSQALGARLGFDVAYEPNKQRRVGHHGNATLTHASIVHVANHDISTNPVERRGALHSVIELDGAPVHIINVHLGLNQRQREAQVDRIAEIVGRDVAPDEPLVLAGDFNDWNKRLDGRIRERMGLHDALARAGLTMPTTWPPKRPRFPLDRVYVRGLMVERGERLAGGIFDRASDHLPLRVTLRRGPGPNEPHERP